MELVIWVVVVAMMLAGLAGTLLPGLPGAPLILLAAVVHRLFLPDYLNWWTILALAGLAGLSFLVEFVFTAIGAKWCKATFWGILGAGVGAMIGLIGGVIGVAIGAFLGAVAGERLLAKRTPEDAIRAGTGACVGLLVSGAGKLLVGAAMVVLFVLGCWLDAL
ncbi:MAG: DUF456 domain-containing protein [Elusimicrobiota bacterium]